MLGSSVGAARHPLGVLPLTVSVDGSDATLALRVDVKPTTAHWMVEAESTWLTADSGVFEKPIVEAAEDVNGTPSTRVVSCTPSLFVCIPCIVAHSRWLYREILLHVEFWLHWQCIFVVRTQRRSLSEHSAGVNS